MRDKIIMEVPPDFNWKTYLKLNPDICRYHVYTTQQGAISHWKQYGREEGRPYKGEIKYLEKKPEKKIEEVIVVDEILNPVLIKLNENPEKLLTIIVPNKLGQTPELTINSLYKQTFKNFDIVIINDTFGNANAARNRGLESVKTPYVLFSDNDIVWESDALEHMMICLDENPEESFAYGYWETEKGIKSREKWNVDNLRRNNYISMMSIVRTEHHPGFDEEIKRFQDWDVWLTMIDNGYTGKYIDKKIFSTPFRKDGITNNSIDGSIARTIVQNKHLVDRRRKNKIIIIPVHNQLEYLKKCVDSIIKNTDKFTLIIVNDGSTDPNTIKWLKRKSKDYIILTNKTSEGFSSACNKGIDYAMLNFDFNCLCLLNSDAEINTKNWFNNVETNFILDEKIGLAGIVSNNAVYQTIYDVPKYLLNIDEKPVYDTYLVHGFCFFIGKNLISTIGHFDDDKFPHYGSEDDYALKSIQNKFKNIIVGSVFAYHEGQQSYSTEKRLMLVQKTLPDLKERWGNDYVLKCVKAAELIRNKLNA